MLLLLQSGLDRQYTVYTVNYVHIKSHNHHFYGLCDECNVYDNVTHFLLDCVKYKDSRSIFQNRLKYTTNQMTLKNIFKDKSNLTHIISFIQDCGINQQK